MFQVRWSMAAVVLCAAMTMCPIRAVAAEQRVLPQQLVPDDALGLMLVNGLAETDAAIGRLARQVGTQAPSLLQMLKISSGVAEGLDEQGSAALVFLANKRPTEEPIVVLLAPVSDYQAILRQLGAAEPKDGISEVTFMGSKFLVAEKSGYGLMVEPKHRAALKRLLKAKPQLPDSLGPIAGWLKENQYAAVLMPQGVELLCDQAVAGLRQVREELSALEDELPEAQMGPALAVFEMYEQVLKTAGDELVLAAIGARLDSEGSLRVTLRLPYRPEGRLAKVLDAFETPDEDVLTGLPAGPYVFALGGTWPQELSDSLLKLSATIMKAAPQLYGLSEEETQKLMAASRQQMKNVQGMSMLMAVGKPGDPLYSNIVGVMRCQDAEAYMEQYAKAMAQTTELLTRAENSVFKEVEVKRRDDGVLVIRMTMKFPATPGMEDVPEFEDAMNQMMEKLVGPGGRMTIYIKIADKHHLVMVYNQEALLGTAIEAVRNSRAGLAADKSVAQTRALMPEDAQWLGLLSPQGLVAYANRAIESVLSAAAEEGFPAPKLPEFPETPPIGCAMRVADQQIQAYFVVPAPVLKGIGEYVQQLQATFAQPAVPEFEQLEPESPEL